MVEAHGDGDVQEQAGIESHLPSVASVVMGLAAGEHQRYAELVIDAQDVGGRITHDRASDVGDPGLGLGDDLWVQLAQETIDLQIAIVAVGVKPTIRYA